MSVSLPRRRALAAAGIGASALALAACGGGSGSAPNTLRVGASPIPHAEILRFVADELAGDAGITIEVEEYTDYQIPNRALADGEIDANYFQTQKFMEQQIQEKGYDLVAFDGVHIEPMGVYSEKIGSLEELQDGDEIAIPNDPTNRGRALDLLAAEGVITLTDGLEPTLGTLDDIVDNPLNLTVSELDGPIIARSLADFAAGVLNGNYALEAGLSPAEDAVVLEEAEGNPNANFLSTTSDRKDDEAIVKLDELLHSEEVKQFIADTYADGSVLAAF